MATINCTVPAGGVRHSQGAGILDPGANVIAHGISPNEIDDPNWFQVLVLTDDPADVTIGAMNPARTEVAVTNNSGGPVAVAVMCQQIHSAIR